MEPFRACFACALALLLAGPALGQGSVLPLPEEKPILGATMPALSPDGKVLAFTYQGDLWTVHSEGGRARRLTVHDAHDAYARWSPDGRWIVFASNRYNSSGAGGSYALNYDLFVIPSTGGQARRLTFYTESEFPGDWSRDGRQILFYSRRGTTYWQEYAIDVHTGVVRTLVRDDMHLRYGVFSPDGSTIAYCRGGGTAVWWRPKYRGSANMEIWTRHMATGRMTRVTDYEGTDLWPLYSADGRTLYYVTDRLTPGVPNLVAAPAGGGKPRLVTQHKEGAVRFPHIALDGSTLAYEHGGRLYTIPAVGGQPRRIDILAATDEKQNSVVRVSQASGLTELEASPDGKTLALGFRGEIWTLPADKGGDARRLVSNPANDYDFWWSPDGARLAFVSDRSGNFDIYVADVKTREVKQVSTDPSDESSPKWSPDGKSIGFVRSGRQGGIYAVPADGSGPPVRVAASDGNNLFGTGILGWSWSPDSRWIAFSRRDPTDTRDIWIVPAGGGKAVNVTYWPGSNTEPEWTSDGKHLLFLSSRDRESGMDLYSLPLQKEREEDDETPARPEEKKDEKAPVEVKIEWDDIENRAKRLTTQGCGAYQITPDGRNAIYLAAVGGPPEYWSVPVKGGSPRRLTSTGEGTGVPRFSRDSSKFWALGSGGTIKSIPTAGGQASQLAFRVRMEVDRRSELAQAFNEFWRRYNVGFYDPGMHGVDWSRVRSQYEPLLASVGCKEDFWMLLSAMVGELNASHSEVSPANGQPGPAVAELGIIFDETHTGPGIRVAGFLPRGPNDDLGPKVKPGEYILQIDGEDVSYGESMWAPLLDKAGRTVELLVNDRPSREGARTVKIKPITGAARADLEYEQRVRAAREQTEHLSGGRLAYIHIRAMDRPSLGRLERELWGKAREKDGLVLDIRNNGGGNTHDDILAQISRRAYGYTQPRDAPRTTQPVRHWDKPIVLLINQNAVSDAEIFTDGFRQLKLGRIVGVETPGYVIGTYSGTLQDGTSYRIPMWGWFDLKGENMENRGVKPDVVVENTPEELAAGKDRQLQTAVELLLKDLERRK